MESVESKVTTYTIHSRVVNTFEKKTPQYRGGIGSEAAFVDVSRGWFVHLEGSWEALYLGQDKPDLAAGDEVVIQIRKRV